MLILPHNIYSHSEKRVIVCIMVVVCEGRTFIFHLQYKYRVCGYGVFIRDSNSGINDIYGLFNYDKFACYKKLKTSTLYINTCYMYGCGFTKWKKYLQSMFQTSESNFIGRRDFLMFSREKYSVFHNVIFQKEDISV